MKRIADHAAALGAGLADGLELGTAGAVGALVDHAPSGAVAAAAIQRRVHGAHSEPGLVGGPSCAVAVEAAANEPAGEVAFMVLLATGGAVAAIRAEVGCREIGVRFRAGRAAGAGVLRRFLAHDAVYTQTTLKGCVYAPRTIEGEVADA